MNPKKIMFFLLMLPAGICGAQDKFSISGKLPNVEKNRMAVLSYLNADGKRISDTALIKNGKFTLSGTTAFANKAYLSLVPLVKDTGKFRRQPDYQEFYLEKGQYKVGGKDSISTAKITGSKSQSEYLQYNKSYMGNMPAKWQDISQRFMKARSVKDSAEMNAISAEAKILMPKMEAALDSFIFNHPDSYVSVDLVNDNKTAIIDAAFDRYYNALSPGVLNSFTGKAMTVKYEKASATAIGKTFDFAQENTQGEMFALSSYKGKYVLVDFWASWCVPCRAENPNLLKAYQQLKDKNFEIVSVSLDDSKAAWLKAVEKDALPWTQVSDLKGWKNALAVKYGITAVPQNLLINGQGVIIAKNLRGEDLTEKLTAVMK